MANYCINLLRFLASYPSTNQPTHFTNAQNFLVRILQRSTNVQNFELQIFPLKIFNANTHHFQFQTFFNVGTPVGCILSLLFTIHISMY